MKENERKKYLAKIDRDTSTVGVELPDTMSINGVELPVSDIVFEISSSNKLPDKVELSVPEIKKNIIRERSSLVDKLKTSDDICKEDADIIVENIKRLDRIINSLASDDMEFKDKHKLNKAKKTKKWRNLVDKIKGNQ